MTDYATKEEKSEVLYAFHLACEYPTSKDIIAWTKQYPQYADDIREHAELLLAQRNQSRPELLKPDEEMLAKGRSEAMSAIYEAEQATAARTAAESNTDCQNGSDVNDGEDITPGISSAIDFDLLLSNACKSIAMFARDIEIDRVVIAEVAAGRVRLPVGDRFVDAISSVLGLANDSVVSAIRQSSRRPRLGGAKARERPVLGTRPFKEVISDSKTMTSEQIQYWLDEPSTWMPGTKSD